MDRPIAKQIAQTHLDDAVPAYAGHLLIIDDSTLETERYFIFFYQHRKWIEEHDRSFRLSGNVPIVIDRQTRSVGRLPEGQNLAERIGNLLLDSIRK